MEREVDAIGWDFPFINERKAARGKKGYKLLLIKHIERDIHLI